MRHADERGYAAAPGPVDHLDDRLYGARAGRPQRLFPRTTCGDDPRRAHLGTVRSARIADRRVRQPLFVAAAEGQRFSRAGDLCAGHINLPGVAQTDPGVESDLHALNPSARGSRRSVVQGSIGREAAVAGAWRAHGPAHLPPTRYRAVGSGVTMAASGVTADGQLRSLDRLMEIVGLNGRAHALSTMSDQFNIYPDTAATSAEATKILEAAYVDEPGRAMF